MQIRLITEKKALLAAIEGELDHHSAKAVRDRIDTEFKRSNAKNIVFDFSRVNFMDSSGIGVIIGRHRLAGSLGGEAVIFSPTSSVRRIIEMSGVHKIIKVTVSLENALELL